MRHHFIDAIGLQKKLLNYTFQHIRILKRKRRAWVSRNFSSVNNFREKKRPLKKNVNSDLSLYPFPDGAKICLFLNEYLV